MDPHEHEVAGGTEEEGSKGQDAGDNPTFSLAGPGQSNPASNAYVGDRSNAWVGDNYRQHNPQYGKEADSPTWSLAGPLPHVMRPGMQHGALPEDRKEDREAGRDGHGTGTDKPHSKDDANNSEEGFFNKWSKFRHMIREPLAEWLGVGYPGYLGHLGYHVLMSVADNRRHDDWALRNIIELHFLR